MSGNGILPARVQALLDFWFGHDGDPDRELHREIWFKSTPEYDDMLRRLFLTDYEQAASGALAGWEEAAESALAVVMLLDRSRTFAARRAAATDAAARAADRAMATGFDAPCRRLAKILLHAAASQRTPTINAVRSH